MHRFIIAVWHSALLLLMACANATFDGADLGSGAYLQILTSGRVVVERDFSGTGFRPCTAQAVLMLRSTPTLKGNVRCSPSATDTPLPFSYVTHIQKTPQNDEVLLTNPFSTRTATSEVCVRWRDATSKQEKTVIVEDKCGSPKTPAAAAASAPMSKYDILSAGQRGVSQAEARVALIAQYLYKQISPATDRPLRAKVIVLPEYPEDLRAKAVQGTVRVRFRIKEDGLASDASVEGNPPAEMAAAAVNSVLKWQFEPITRNAKAVSIWLNYEFIFRLE